MRFYTQQHTHYCGIDLHARTARLEKKHGKAKALTALAHKLGRAVYYILQRQKAFDMKRFLNG